ncbi:HIT family protein [Methylobacterium oryzihabitans]|uniref:HIT family protein n=1 Tax=Methylobacterium oryzihabitans TaxID=2499852 RepID=A0A437NX57_9HYPH|nr:HIT family protein [Methylobacterium oryzihabitans]RVU14582.1 HIT family protein [Methylobacterium oryzihabitans]
MTTAYDPGNVFGKILRGELPAYKVYEDAHTLAFMDVMPQGRGHALVIPKTPSRNLLDADPAVLGPLYATVQRVAKAAVAAFGADGAVVTQFNEAEAGQTVFHLHVHVVPRFSGVSLRPHGSRKAEADELAADAEILRAALA